MYHKHKIKYKLYDSDENKLEKINNKKKITKLTESTESLKSTNIFYYINTDRISNIIKYNNKVSAKIINAKNKIDNYNNYNNYNQWDKAKKITNPYDKIYITYKKKKNEPLSRSYFKMIEMSQEFLKKIIDCDKPIKTVHLAEGPGGFIEGLIELRKLNSSVHQYKDKYYGMTLAPKNEYIPGWTRSCNFLKKNKNVYIVKGIDNTGDLYNVDNHNYLISRIGNDKADLVTGDGGFDFSVDYNQQEILAYKLIFSQIILGLSIQAKHGTFICKLFDTNTLLSKQMIYILMMHYKRVYYYKPVTSRPANSEKYIICEDFSGINDYEIYQLQNILTIWNKLPKSYSVTSIMEEHTINDKMIEAIDETNNELQDIQISYINSTISLIKKPMNRYDLTNNINTQVKNSESWINNYADKLIDQII